MGPGLKLSQLLNSSLTRVRQPELVTIQQDASTWSRYRRSTRSIWWHGSTATWWMQQTAFGTSGMNAQAMCLFAMTNSSFLQISHFDTVQEVLLYYRAYLRRPQLQWPLYMMCSIATPCEWLCTPETKSETGQEDNRVTHWRTGHVMSTNAQWLGWTRGELR